MAHSLSSRMLITFFLSEGLLPKEPNAILFRHGNQFFRGCHARDALTAQATFSQLAETKWREMW